MTHDWFTHPALCPDNVTTDAKPIGSPEAQVDVGIPTNTEEFE